MVSVTIKRFLNLVERQFKTGTMKPVLGIGKGGIGKTEGIYNLTKKLGIGFKEIRLLLYSEVDLVGLPIIDPKTGETNWARNSLFPVAERDGEKGILVLDEITSASINIRTAAYQLLDSKRSLGQYKLPDGWLVVGLGNGEEDGGNFQGLEGNLINRCSVYRVTPDLGAWKEWAAQNDVNPIVVAFLSFAPDMLHNYNPDISAEQFASPRSWKALSDELNYNERIGKPFDPDDELLSIIAAGCVGDAAANKFVAFYAYRKSMIEPEDVLSGKAKMPYDVRDEVIHMAIQSSIKLFSDHFKVAKERGNIDKKVKMEMANLVKWVIELRKIKLDFAVLGINDLVASCDGFAEIAISDEFEEICPEFTEFAMEQSLLYDRDRSI